MNRAFFWVLGATLVFGAMACSGNRRPEALGEDDAGVDPNLGGGPGGDGGGGGSADGGGGGSTDGGGGAGADAGGWVCSNTCNGCCQADGTCVTPSNQPSACGLWGARCQVCKGSQQCLNGVCQDLTCSGCIDAQGQCVLLATDAGCGALGTTCQACTGGASCLGGACRGGDCPGACKDFTLACQPGNLRYACGTDGDFCHVCALNQECKAGTCQPKDGGSCKANGGSCVWFSDCCSAYCQLGKCAAAPWGWDGGFP